MLAIRMQRTGRKGYPTYRVIVQEAHRQPTSGRVVAAIGTYNPHTKEATLDTQKAEYYLKNGAQPSDRVVKLLQAEKVTLPTWVVLPDAKKQKSIKNAEKLRKNRPAEASDEDAQSSTDDESSGAAKAAPEKSAADEAPAPEAEVAPAEEVAEPTVAVEAPAEEASESTEQIAAAEVADGQESAEEEIAAEATPEAADPNAEAEDQAEKPAE